MSKKIIGVTVGTPTSPKKIEKEINPVKTVNRQDPDENGNVEVVGNNGVDGISPTISVSPITGGHRITITDKGGTKTVDVMDGADGVGIANIAKTSTNGKVDTYTITLTNGTKTTFTVTNGTDGTDGKDGADGYTPVKGTDYFTAEDKAEMISELADKLSLGIASDGLIYIFVDGTPVGTGIPQGQSGDVFGYVDENNTIVLNGNLADGTYTVKYEMDNGNIVNVGNMVLDSTVYYSVTSTLTKCTNSNSTKTVAEGSSYSATITANSGYDLKTVTVTMGGSPVTVTNGVINIASVTGDIVITAIAEEKTKEPTNLFVVGGDGYVLNGRCSSGGANRTDSNGCLVTNYIKVSKGATVYLNKEIVSAVHSGMKLIDGSVTGFLPTDTNYITNLSSSNGITQFTVNNTNANYIRLCIKINYGTAITDTDVINAGVIVTVNEPLS